MSAPKPDQAPLFEVIESSEFEAAHAQPDKPKKSRIPKTEPRKLVVWWGLTTFLGTCTVPRHDEIQEQQTPEGKEYRRAYGRIRMVANINDILVCRDCFLKGADKE